MPFNEFKLEDARERVKKLESEVATLTVQIADNAEQLKAAKDSFDREKTDQENELNGIKQNILNNVSRIEQLETDVKANTETDAAREKKIEDDTALCIDNKIESMNKLLQERFNQLTESISAVSAKTECIYKYIYCMPQNMSDWMSQQYPDTYKTMTELPNREATLDWSEVTNAESAFDGCAALTKLPANILMPKCTSYRNTFNNCSSLEEITVDIASITELGQLSSIVAGCASTLVVKLINANESLKNLLKEKNSWTTLQLNEGMTLYVNGELVKDSNKNSSDNE